MWACLAGASQIDSSPTSGTKKAFLREGFLYLIKPHKMYAVYAIASINSKYVYVGLTSNLQKRLARHNNRFEKTTKPYAPFILIYSEVIGDRPTARIKEKYLKSRSGKRFLYKIILHLHKDLYQYNNN